MINSRNKGAVAERKVSELFRVTFGCELVRNLDQARSGGSDLKIVNVDRGERYRYSRLLRQFSIEVKRYARVTETDISGFWNQACNQARRENGWPMLVVQEDRKPPLFYVPLAFIGIGSTRSIESAYSAMALTIVGLADLFDNLDEEHFDGKKKRQPWETCADESGCEAPDTEGRTDQTYS